MGDYDINKYFEICAKYGYYSTPERLSYKINTLFNNRDFDNLSFLDIGGGFGVFAIYVALRNAKNVVILEPEAEGKGGTSELFEKFNFLLNKFPKLNNISFEPTTFQDYNPKFQFDVILSHNSINHLNETACINLLESNEAKEEYHKLFMKLSSIIKPNGELIICDGARDNFFNHLKIKNPLAPKIEWYKHQNPNIWIDLLKKHGFKLFKQEWSTPNRFGKIGRILLSNRIMSYFTTSQFCFKMKKIT